MKRIISLLTLLIITLAYSSAFAANENGRDLVFDNAGVLSEQEFNNIEARLEEVSNAHDFDAVVAIVNNTGDKGIVSFSDDFFDYRGYGRGSNRSGVIMVISIGTDKRYISTSGDCINAYTDDIISYIGGDLAASVDKKNYFEACEKYIKYADQIIGGYRSGKPFTVPFSIGVLEIIIIAAIAVIVTIIGSKLAKSSMNDAITPIDADIYAKGGSATITKSRDLFLYSNVSRTKRQTSSSGSSTHTSSSGRTHGGGSF